MSELTVHTVVLDLCNLCLNGAGGECHVPGCVLWMNRAPDIAIAEHPSFHIIDQRLIERVTQPYEYTDRAGYRLTIDPPLDDEDIADDEVCVNITPKDGDQHVHVHLPALERQPAAQALAGRTTYWYWLGWVDALDRVEPLQKEMGRTSKAVAVLRELAVAGTAQTEAES